MKFNKELGLIVFSLLAIFVCGYITVDYFYTDEVSSSDQSKGQEVLEAVVGANKETIKKIYGYPQDSVYLIEGKISKNDNFTDLLHDHHIAYESIFALAKKCRDIFDVRKIAVNKKYTLICTKDSLHAAKCFVYHENKTDYVVFKFGDTLDVYRGHKPVRIEDRVLKGSINNSLYNAIIDAGGTAVLANKLADVFAWEIDFFGLQKNDEFEFIYQQRLVEGELAGVDAILAAKFKHNNKMFTAYSYDQGNGPEYFDREGESLRKTFLKAPLSFTRISSHFSHSRLHPVLKIRRPHHGVDYAAPKGTPVVAIGDGTIIKANYSGGAGNYVKVKHNSVYTSGYMHLSGYGAQIKVGKQVQQGQVIGYVGSTGLSTGPHLDFRIWKNGAAVNPLSLDPPSADPLKDKYKKDFLKKVKVYDTALNAGKKTLVTAL